MSTAVVADCKELPKNAPDLPNVPRDTFTLTFDNCNKGLGIKIIGGCSVTSDHDYGVFVKRIIPGGLADLSGELCPGDQILSVNHDSLEGVTNERGVALLRKASASNQVVMVIARDMQARQEFVEVLERQMGMSLACTPVPPDTLSMSSSSSTIPSLPLDVPLDKIVSKPFKQSHPALNNNQPTPMREEYNDDPLPSSLPPYLQPHYLPSYNNSLHNLSPTMASTPHEKHGVVKAHPSSTTPTGTTSLLSSRLLPRSENPFISPRLSDSLMVRSDTSDASYSLGSLDNDGNVIGSSNHISPINPPSRSSITPRSPTLPVDPTERFKIDKLYRALKYVGHEPTGEQESAINSRVTVDTNGFVQYSDFVTAAKEVLHTDLSTLPLSMDMPLFSHNVPAEYSPLNPPAPHTECPVGNMDEARAEIDRLKVLLKEREQSCNMMEEEILGVRKEAQGAIHESRSLRSKVHLAEQAQRAARDMEQDYEDVVRLMEHEISQLKLKSLPTNTEGGEWQKRVAVLTCQLKKSESTKKTYEVATEKLLNFVEHVHETLRSQENGIPLSVSDTNPAGESGQGSKPPGYLGKHKTTTARTLANEARDIVRAVKAITDSQSLPYGWEQAYSQDGVKYYINHLTQTTSWSHPISNVQHLPYAKDVNKPAVETDA